MALGYDGKLYILAFDHRGSFQKKMFGIEGTPDEEQTATIADAKRLIFEGMQEAVSRGAHAEATGVLVDEQFGSDIPQQARQGGLKLAMPVPSARQKGELADSASSTGICTRIPLATWIAFSASSTPTCTWTPKISSWRATNRSAETRSR